MLITTIKAWWSGFMEWYNSPWTTFEKVRKSPWSIVLVVVFLVQPIVTFTIDTVQDVGWIHHKLDPQVSKNKLIIDDLEKRVEKLEKK